MYKTNTQKISEKNQAFFSNLPPDRFEDKSASSASNPFIGYSREKQFRLMIDCLKPCRQDKILCVGVGSGREVEILSSFVEKVYGVDISEGFLNYCNKKFEQRFEGCLCDLENDRTIYNEGFFDKVVCLNVLPYFTIGGIHNFFREMSRVMKKGGQLFVFVLNAKFPYAGLLQDQLLRNRMNDSRAVYFYRPVSDYVNAFSRHGFMVSNSEGGDLYCDINSIFFRSLFDVRWSQLLMRLMDFGGRTGLKRYYRSLYLTLTKQSFSEY